MDKRRSIDMVSGQENRDRQSEILLRLMTSSRNIDALNGEAIEEVFNTETEYSRRALIERLSGEEYIGLLEGVNGILRGKNKEEWNMDGVGVTAAGHEVIGAHIFPRHDDKRDILQKTWEAAQRMNQSHRSLEDIGMLLGSLLVETHPFNDGNGRLSRFIFRLTKDGFDRDDLKIVLGEDGRYEGDMALSKIDIDRLFYEQNSNINTSHIDSILPDEELPYGQLEFPQGSDPEAVESIVNAGRNDAMLFTISLFQFLQEHPSLSVEDMIKVYGRRKVLLVQRLAKQLSPNDIKELADMYWATKKNYTEGIIDIFENPDKPEFQIERNGQTMRLLDHFKQRIQSKTVLL